VELAFGGMLAGLEDAPPALRASGQVAQGVALVALGRPSAALVALDSAVALFPDPAKARLQAAEWRVIPGAVGAPGVIEAEAERGRGTLAALAARPGGAQAAWALAVDALARRDTAAGRHWQTIVAGDDSADGALGVLLAAMAAAARGSPDSALVISEPALASDSAGYAPDPFFRAVLHLLRGEWQVAAGRPDQADRSWLWYENTDAVGWPDAEAQPAEVDWALGSWARVRRASLASAGGRRDDACALAGRVLEIWRDAEPPTARVADSLRTSLASCRP
jgi:hypothetical protein